MGMTAVLLLMIGGALGLIAWHRSSRPRKVQPQPQPQPSGESVPPPLPTAVDGAGPRVEVAARFDMDSWRHCHPSTALGPDPIDVPASGYQLYLRVVSHEPHLSVRVTLSAAVIDELPLGEAEVAIGSRIEAAVPDVEILLDTQPPLIRPTVGPDGNALRPDVTFPAVLAPGETRIWRLAPLTDSQSLMRWRLNVAAVTTESETLVPVPQVVTGDHGWVRFSPDGTSARVPHPGSRHWRPHASA